MLAVICVNLITNPVLNLLSYASTRLWDWQNSVVSVTLVLVGAEAVVVLVEWGLLAWALGGGRRRLLLVSLAMNAASTLAGVILFW